MALMVLIVWAHCGPSIADIAIDPESDACLLCHPEKAPTDLSSFLAKEHPIGISYPAMWTPDYRPLGEVRSVLELPDDRIGCLSCHDDAAAEHGAVLSPEGGLCRTCHDM